MWRTANPLKVAATHGYGAEIDQEAENAADAHERLLEHVEPTGAEFVHPFDDPVLQSGHGTLGLEVVEDVPGATRVVVPVGGGGLIAGVATARAGNQPHHRRRAGGGGRADARAGGRRAGPDRRSRSPTGSPRRSPGRARLAVCRERVDEVVLVSEEEIEEAFRFLYARAKLACEPAGAASTAALLAGKIALEPGKTRSPLSRRQCGTPNHLCYPGADEDRHPSGVRPRDRALRVRQRVPDALDEARAARRDLLGLPSVLHGQAKLMDTGGRVERFQRKLERRARASKKQD